MTILGEKALLSLSVPRVLKQLIEIQNDINVYFHTSLKSPKKRCENKTFMSFYPLVREWGNNSLDWVFAELLSYAISVSLAMVIHKNNTNTPRATTKQYHKKYFSKSFYQT